MFFGLKQKFAFLFFAAFLVSIVSNVWATNYTWDGSTSNDWSVAQNWSPANGPPTSSDTVVIQNVTTTSNRFPVLSADVTVASLTMNAGSKLDGAKSLTVTGTATLNGTIGGTTPLVNVTFTGAVTVAGTTNVTLSGNWTNANSITNGTSLNIKLGGDFNNNSGSTITVNSIEFTGVAGTTSFIKGTNIFTDFTCTAAGKKIDFPTNLTTVNNFNIVGAAGNETQLIGTSWQILFTGTSGTYSSPNMKHVIVTGSRIQVGQNIYVLLTASALLWCSDNPDNGATKWIFTVPDKFEWTGAVSTVWNNANNWRELSIPAITDSVRIPNVANKPNITSAVEVKDAEIAGDVNGTATLTIKEKLDITGATTINPPVKASGITTIDSGISNNVFFTNAANIFTGAIIINSVKNIVLKTNNAMTISGGENITNSIQLFGPFVNFTDPITNADVYISGATTFNAAPITFGKNLYIAAGSTNAVVFNTDITVKGSFVLFSGNVTFPSSTTIDKDLVLLNGDFSNSFPYITPLRTGESAQPSITAFPTKFPDGTDISTPYSSAVTGLNGKTITVKTNLYVNKVNLTATSNWNLILNGNSNATSAIFAEAYGATIQNSTVTATSTTNGNYAWISTLNCTQSGSNSIASATSSGWAFTPNPIVSAQTMYDNVIRLEFTNPVFNINNQIWNAATTKTTYKIDGINYTGTFNGAFADENCTISLNGNSAYTQKYFYLKTSGAWNTDATGTSAGAPESTDRAGIHKTSIPAIKIESLFFDQYKNRIIIPDFTATTDKCRPVLIEVRTGQELHNPFASQKLYDAHNFIEFKFSEPVKIYKNSAKTAADEVPESAVNIQSTADFGAIDGASGLKIAGFATIAGGKLITGAQSGVSGKTDIAANLVHALYRNFSVDGATYANQPNRLRIGIASFVDGTIDIGDGTGNYSYYPGYIEEAILPSGTVTVIDAASGFITDLVANALEPTSNSYAKPNISINSSTITNQVYGTWDTLAPIPARVYWNIAGAGNEIIGFTDGGNGIRQFEFHFLDNKTDFSEGAANQWNWNTGWSPNNIKPDFAGGSRPNFTGSPVANTTLGGIRASSLYNAHEAFTVYDFETMDFLSGFIKVVERTVKLTAFFGTPIDAATNDTLYFSLKPTITNLKSRSTYFIDYDETKGFITDLAGNRVKSSLWETTDRVTPRIRLTVSALNDTQLFIYFNKKIAFEDIGENATLSTMHEEFEFFDASKFPSLDPADVIPDLFATHTSLVFQTDEATGIILTLSRTPTIKELTSAYISLKQKSFIDPYTGENIIASKICDITHNWMDADIQIPITYFGVNMIKPVFATNEADFSSASNNISNTFSDQIGKTTIRNFDGSASLFWNTKINAQFLLNFNPADLYPQTPERTLSLFADVNPVPDSISTEFEEKTGKKLNFWMPTKTLPYAIFSLTANTKAKHIFGSVLDTAKKLYSFTIDPKDFMPFNIGDSLQFLFQYGTIKMPNTTNGALDVDSPFYIPMLANPADPISLAEFSIKLLDITRQRGGSTILNNVINVNKKEKTVLEVIMPNSGNLNVAVLTLDGNVIKYLHKGNIEAGKTYFYWDGTNLSGQPVARGMYFIRITAQNIDETRKVMVIKE